MWWSRDAAVDVGPVTETETASAREPPRARGRKEAWEGAATAAAKGRVAEEGRNGDGTERKAAGSAGSAAAASDEAVGGGIVAGEVRRLSHSSAGWWWGRGGGR